MVSPWHRPYLRSDAVPRNTLIVVPRPSRARCSPPGGRSGAALFPRRRPDGRQALVQGAELPGDRGRHRPRHVPERAISPNCFPRPAGFPRRRPTIRPASGRAMSGSSIPSTAPGPSPRVIPTGRFPSPWSGTAGRFSASSMPRSTTVSTRRGLGEGAWCNGERLQVSDGRRSARCPGRRSEAARRPPRAAASGRSSACPRCRPWRSGWRGWPKAPSISASSRPTLRTGILRQPTSCCMRPGARLTGLDGSTPVYNRPVPSHGEMIAVASRLHPRAIGAMRA